MRTAREVTVTLERGGGGNSKRLGAAPPRRMTEAQIEAAALADANAKPLSPRDFRTLPRVPRIKTLRRALQLTQDEFAARYHIPLGTLRDWEQGRTEPDQPARAFLTVIARDPDGVRDLLAD